uniref:Uncharacterized protein n=1 Tax=Romanomermis culicivorax TaxID=13658 RepID=A0A915ILC6_ROMCU
MNSLKFSFLFRKNIAGHFCATQFYTKSELKAKKTRSKINLRRLAVVVISNVCYHEDKIIKSSIPVEEFEIPDEGADSALTAISDDFEFALLFTKFQGNGFSVGFEIGVFCMRQIFLASYKQTFFGDFFINNRSSDTRVQLNLIKSMNSLIRVYATENPPFFIHHSDIIVSNILNSMQEWMNHIATVEFFNYQFILHHPRNSNRNALSPDWKNFVQELYRRFYILLVYKEVDVSTMGNRVNADALMELISRVFLQIFSVNEEISVQNCSQFNSTLMRRMITEGDQETKRRCIEIGFATILDRINQKLHSSSVVNL